MCICISYECVTSDVLEIIYFLSTCISKREFNRACNFYFFTHEVVEQFIMKVTFLAIFAISAGQDCDYSPFQRGKWYEYPILKLNHHAVGNVKRCSHYKSKLAIFRLFTNIFHHSKFIEEHNGIIHNFLQKKVITIFVQVIF